MKVIEYNLIISNRLYKLIRVGGKKATITFEEGNELQRYMGWLLLNRDCKVYVHDYKGEVTKVINSDKVSGGKE